MNQVKLCECIICGDIFFTHGDLVTVECSSGVIYHGRVKTISRHTALGQIQYIVLDTSSEFNSSDKKIDITEITNIYEYEVKGGEEV